MMSDYENDFVSQIAKSMGDIVWMGLSDRFSEGHWIWTDGSETKFTMWNAGIHCFCSCSCIYCLESVLGFTKPTICILVT